MLDIAATVEGSQTRVEVSVPTAEPTASAQTSRPATTWRRWLTMR
ncbi:hypothetical protein ACFQ9X_20790 [Catenulispora yoronensis]